MGTVGTVEGAGSKLCMLVSREKTKLSRELRLSWHMIGNLAPLSCAGLEKIINEGIFYNLINMVSSDGTKATTIL